MVIMSLVFSRELNKTAIKDPRLISMMDPPPFQKIGCPDVNLTTFGGYIMSPKYPKNYPNETTKNYSIEVDPGFVVKLKFLDFEVETSMFGCDYDSVTGNALILTYYTLTRFVIEFSVYDSDGSELTELCGYDNPPPIISSDNTMTVVFKSDSALTMRGFKAMYEQIGNRYI